MEWFVLACVITGIVALVWLLGIAAWLYVVRKVIAVDHYGPSRKELRRMRKPMKGGPHNMSQIPEWKTSTARTFR